MLTLSLPGSYRTVLACSLTSMAPLASLPVPDLKISPLRRPRKVTEGPRQIFILTHSRRILAASPTFCPPSGGSLRAAQAPRVSPPLHTSQSLQGGGGGGGLGSLRCGPHCPRYYLRTTHLLPTGPRAAPPLGSAPLRAAATLAAAGSRF